MKYRIRYEDPNDLWLTPFALFAILFAFMGINGHWIIERKKHWWNRWEEVKKYDRKVDAYIEYFKLKYNLNIKKEVEFPHNRNKNKKQTCVLTFQHNDHPCSPEYTYMVGYKPRNYARFYHACYSEHSYEDALMKLWGDMEIKKILWKNDKLNKSYINVEKQRHELEKIELEK